MQAAAILRVHYFVIHPGPEHPAETSGEDLRARDSKNLGAPALVNTPQKMRRIERGQFFARSKSAAAVAFVTAILVFSGESLLYARRSVSTSKLPLTIAKPTKSTRTSTEIERGPRGKSEIALNPSPSHTPRKTRTEALPIGVSRCLHNLRGCAAGKKSTKCHENG